MRRRICVAPFIAMCLQPLAMTLSDLCGFHARAPMRYVTCGFGPFAPADAFGSAMAVPSRIFSAQHVECDPFHAIQTLADCLMPIDLIDARDARAVPLLADHVSSGVVFLQPYLPQS